MDETYAVLLVLCQTTSGLYCCQLAACQIYEIESLRFWFRVPYEGHSVQYVGSEQLHIR